MNEAGGGAMPGLRNFLSDQIMLGIVLFMFLIAEMTIFLISDGVSIVLTHFFYFPVILAAFQYPRRGALIATALGIVYLVAISFFDPQFANLVSAFMQFYVYVSVGIVVAYLSATLKLNERKYRSIFNNSGSCVCLIDTSSWKMLEANDRCITLFGDPHGANGCPILECWSEKADRDAFFERLAAEGMVSDIEISLNGIDGMEHRCLISGGTVRDELAVLTVTDITGRKQSEDALRESEQRFRELADLLPQVVFEIDRDGRLLFVNRSAVTAFGYSPEDVLKGFYVPAIVAEGDRERLLANISRRMRGESIEGMEYCALRKDGTKVPVIIYGAPIIRDGVITGIRGIMVDITERKQFEEALQTKNRQLAIINGIIRSATSSPDTDAFLAYSLEKILQLLAFDAGAIYIFCNDTHVGLKTVQGLNAAEHETFVRQLATLDATKNPYYDYFYGSLPRYVESIDDDDKSASASDLRMFARSIGMTSFAAIPLTSNGKVRGAMFIASRKQREFLPEMRDMIETIGSELASAIHQNILRKQLESSIAEANLYLDIMVHDINNANMASLGYTELLAGDHAGGEPGAALITKLLSSVRQSASIIENVSTIRKIREESQMLRPISLDPVIRAEIRRFPDIAITYAATNEFVCANELLAEVFTNLIGNASKFGGSDVTITITVAAHEDEVLVGVLDTGEGISDAQKSRIFNRLEAGDNSRRGKGLGLSICRMLVETYGGRIWAEDRVPGHPEEGLAIWFTLRRAGRKDRDA
ncbi:MAG: PAS domain S-box protein [Methanomicrobiales archaeon]|nr:PAS domain S-box protein [Methanomicrobiales archaeon]